MPHISALRGLRYDPGHVGSLEGVVAPPHDEIDSARQSELYKQHPANVIRLTHNRDELGDEDGKQYERAGRFFRNWQRERLLQLEPDPAIYVYHQVFEYEGSTYTRRGFLCRNRLERLGEGAIFAIEETDTAKSLDRLRLTKSCRANLSPVLGVVDDEGGFAQEILEYAVAGVAPVQAQDPDGVVHRIWPVTDIRVINDVTSAMASKPTFIADGLPEYEAAIGYRDELGGEDLDHAHGANSCLMMCVGIDDPGLIALPTHRLFRGIPAVSSDELKSQLGKFFDVRIAGEGADLAEMIWDQFEIDEDQGAIGLYCRSDERWVVAKINDAGRTKMSEICEGHSDEWQSLGICILDRLIMETVLGLSNCPLPRTVHRIEQLIEELEAEDVEDDGSHFELAAIVLPIDFNSIQSICKRGERLPSNSTYFHPKPLSGFVFNSHDA